MIYKRSAHGAVKSTRIHLKKKVLQRDYRTYPKSKFYPAKSSVKGCFVEKFAHWAKKNFFERDRREKNFEGVLSILTSEISGGGLGACPG